MDSNKIKSNIIERYDRTANALDKREWLEKGASPRVPESRSAHYFIDRKVQEALKFCKHDENLRAMEIGCSFGNMTCLLAQKFKKLIAVDISPKSIEVAKKRLERYGVAHVQFFADDAEQLHCVQDHSLDVIFAFSTLRFCPDINRALHSIYRKLDNNGLAVIDFPNKLSPWHYLFKPLLGIDKHIHDHLYSRKQILTMFRQAGFREIEYKYILFTTRRLPDALLPLFRIIDRVCERIPLLKNFAGIIIVKGKKGETG